MREWVKAAMSEGAVNSADTAFADLMQTLATEPSDELWCASVLASAAVQNGDVCVTVSSVANEVTVSYTHLTLPTIYSV